MSLHLPLPVIRFAIATRRYQRQRQLTLGDLLLENRIVFLQGEIYTGNANEVVMKLLYLQSENRRKDIHFYINSPGGDVAATLAIYDTMQILSCPVATYCVGPGGQRGGGAAGRRHQGQAVRPAQRPRHAAPALRRRAGADQRHRNPGQRNPPLPRGARTRSWPSTPASRSSGSPRTPTATSSSAPKRPRTTAWSMTSLQKMPGAEPDDKD